MTPPALVGEELIEREPAPLVGRIFFEGNRELEAGEMLERMSVRRRPWLVWGEPQSVDRRTLLDDAVRVENMYKRAGYYHARVVEIRLRERNGFVDITFAVDEDEPVRISKVADILYPDADPDELEALARRNPLVPDDVFSASNYLGTQRRLRSYLRNSGYYASEVTPEAWVDPAAYSAEVTYTVYDGPRVRFGEVRIEETRRVDPDIIRRELLWEEGEWYSEELVERTIDELHGLNLFRLIRIEPGEFDPQTRTLPQVISASEAPPQMFRAGVGYGTEDGVRLQARYEHFNFLGDARRFSAIARTSFLLQNLELSLVQPYIFGTRSAASLTAEYRRERILDAFSYERYTLTPRLNRRLSRRTQGFVGYMLEYNRAFDVLVGVPLVEQRAVDPGLLSGLVAGIERNTTDSPLTPRSGNVSRARGLFAGTVLGGRFDFYNLLGETRQYFNPFRRWVYVTRLEAGVADPFGDSRVPLYERFYSGGDDSVRGYRRDRLGPAIGGHTLVEMGHEARYRFPGGHWAAVFVDMGMVSTEPYNWDSGEVRWGIGPGYRIETILGLVRADIGIPLQPRVDEPNWRFHLSIGQTF